MKGIEEMVDQVLAGHKLVKPRRKTKHVWKLSPLTLLLLVGAVSAMLISSLFFTYSIRMTGDVDLVGRSMPMFLWDGEPFNDGSWHNVTCDLTQLNASETKKFQHSIQNIDDFVWLCTFEEDFNFDDLDPMDPLYGYNFSVTDMVIDGTPVSDPLDWKVSPGSTMVFNYTHFLHGEFVDTDVDLEFNVTASLTKCNGPPEPEDDYIHVDYSDGGVMSLDVTANDFDFEDDILTIDHITPMQYAGLVGLTIEPDDKTVTATILGTGLLPGDRTFVVTISDGMGNTADSNLVVHCTL